jgi:transcriptional regulator with XRE-family HTH domain
MNNLKNLRIERGLSQQSLADKLGVSQQSIYKYENQITEPNIDMLKIIADFFDVSVDYLIGYSSCAHKVEDVQETELNNEELHLIQTYRSLPTTSRHIFQQLITDYNNIINNR